MKLSSLVVAASLAFASVAAQAGTVSYSTAFGSSPFSETLTLPKFDSTFGTLIGSTLTLSFEVLAQVQVLNLGDSNASFDSASASFEIKAKSNGADATSFSITGTASTPGAIVPPGVDNRLIRDGLNGVGVGSQVVGPSGLPSYVGASGDTITFAVSALDGVYSGVGPVGKVGFGGSGSVTGGTLSVAYAYETPTSPIPEPSTAVLMGLGMLAIGASLRRRRNEG